MNLFSLPLVIATILILVSYTSVFSQQRTSTQQIYQGCSGGIYDYSDADQNYSIWSDPISGERKLLKLTRIETSGSRFLFTFVPKSVTVQQGEKLELEVFPFGRETEFGKPKIENPFAINNLSLEKRSTLEEEKLLPFDWNQAPLATATDTGEWFAIYQKDFNMNERYILPITSPSVTDGVNVQLMPSNRYLLEDGSAITIPKEVLPIPQGNVRRLKSLEKLSDRTKLELDTTGLEPGVYWVSLQGNAVFNGQNIRECPKTTASVRIEVVNELKVELDPHSQGPVSFQNSGEYTVTANIKGTGPFALEWKSSNPNGVDVSGCPKNTDTNQAVCNVVRTVPGNLTEGERTTITATVTNKWGKASCAKDNKCAELIINKVPTIQLVAKSSETKDDYPIIVTATVRDDDKPAQSLTIKNWLLSNQGNTPVKIPVDSTISDNSANSQTVTINSGLRIGQNTFVATVSDTLDEATNENSTNTNTTIDSAGAGINYFGFANPIPGKENDFDPENWIADRKPANENPYPQTEFVDFYEQTKVGSPSTTVDNNTIKLNMIADELKKNLNFKLYIYGYADFKNGTKNKPYSNTLLAKRRIEVVIGRLENLGIEANRLVNAGIIKITNCGDSAAVSKDTNHWTDARRHDRRVEFIYVSDDKKPILPTYLKPCKPTASATGVNSNGQKANSLSNSYTGKQSR